ncbi:hypothetical protein ROZALSC1DRAFT_31098 [Rozella allomycis CSF55]|uniref:Zinc finger, C2H2 domain-containing protein n=1 Tax=Rozella allomycis (strain CSF55) TaxID=988480 RepID=A0A075ASL0_ROZAC|nr:Zinc finger, C2H2 domain-containing protein [Rozella allomycis CSF55]RKP17054.1 hypothetical protein ROZALSC1DRAFT_31098 [Rozella allomycis CSF55]|eukprot:EPZ33248.1 Zinc finger, C2H2 domain-containing protein [Rozella allomycis CSF55]
MTFDLDKKYTLQEFIALNEQTDFPIEIDGEIVSGFELLEDGRLLPTPQTPPFKEWAVLEIGAILRDYAKSKICPGNVTSSQGGYKFAQYNLEVNDGHGHIRTIIRAPDIAFVPRNVARNLDANQLFTFKGEPFTPTFVIEVEDISTTSRYEKIKKKICEEYFSVNSSIRLAWLIDPQNKIAVEFYRNALGKLVWKYHNPWVNLSGRDTLPQFTLRVKSLKYDLERNLISTSDEEDDIDIKCPTCEFSYNNYEDFIWHFQDQHVGPSKEAKEDRKRVRQRSLSPRKKMRQ